MDLALESLTNLNAEQLRELARDLIARIAQQSKLHVQAIAVKDSDILYRQAKIDKLTHELATLKRWKFGRSSEQRNAGQISLIEETIEADIAAIEQELINLAPAAKPEIAPRRQPKRAALPAELPRVDVRHDPDSTTCGCGCQLKRIGEDVAEKLDYTPGVFTVERHIRGKWVCDTCETLIQAPVPAQIIDKGIPTAGLLAQVLVAKYCDHLPLYRQENIFARAGYAIPRSTLAQWVGACGVQLQPLVDALKDTMLKHAVLHADETPVAMLKPGNKKTHRAYLFAYAPGAFEDLKAVVYDFGETRAGVHARTFLGKWRGSLVCDDYAGYVAAEDMWWPRNGRCATH
jgi:transposase